MKLTAFDDDKVLTEYLTDYADGNLDRAEVDVFEEYLGQNPEEKEFARKSLKGKRALRWMAQMLENSSVEDENFV